MEDELLKRNTDCVYFLASPLTCKKGAECEYRHSEMAKLNPRDCWYWLYGKCLNSSCAFRHPPLEIHNEKSTEATVSEPNQSSVPATKSAVPCYYYYNGFCSKGNKCPFLHEPVNTFARKSNMGNTVSFAPVPLLNNKTSVRSVSGSIQVEKHSSSSEMTMASGNELKAQQNLQPQKSAVRKVIDQTTCKQNYVPRYGQPTAVKDVSLKLEDYSPNSDYKSTLGSDRSSEELIDGKVVLDERCESSPGFDVLVDEQNVDMDYEDDLMYTYQHDGDDRDCNQVLMKHDPVDQIGYVDERGFFSNELWQESEFSDDEPRADFRRYSPRRTQRQKVRHVVAHNRKFCFGDSIPGGCNNMDLRDYLSRRKMANLYLDKHDVRHDLVHTRDERQVRVRRHAPNQHLLGRLSSKVERNGVQLGRKTEFAAAEQRGRLRNSPYDGYRRYSRFRRHPSSVEGQQRPYLIRNRDAPPPLTSAGLKSLVELKEDKNQGHHSKNGSVDFDGPKPLSEILKEKKRISF